MKFVDTVRRPQAPLGLADRFWLLAHDSLSWKPQLAETALGFGLAAALLGEQIFVRNCRIVNDEIRWDRMPRLADSLVQWVAYRLYAADFDCRKPVKIAAGLDLLRRDAYADVADRLCRFGIVRREDSRRTFRSGVRYSVVDTRVGVSLRAHLYNALFSDSMPKLHDQFLAGLVWTTYLTKNVFPDEYESAPMLEHHRNTLPPVHRLIVDCAQVGIDAALAGRGGH